MTKLGASGTSHGRRPVSYEGADDARLLADLRTALKRWHKPTLGDTTLAEGLSSVERCQAADARLTRSAALRQVIQSGLNALRDRDRVEQADLLERRYLHEQGVLRLAETYHLCERSIYYRLTEAHLALAHALWALEPRTPEPVPASFPTVEPPPAPWRARHLPPPTYPELFGMDQELARLLDYLNDPAEHWLISLDGMGGLGKTALAREAAGRVADTARFADIAWVTVKPQAYPQHGPQQPDPPALTCGEVLDALGSQLGGIEAEPLPLPAKRDRVRSLLGGRAYLAVLDNLETVMDCGTLPDWLRDMANPSKFLLTSRHWLETDSGLTVLSVNPLAEPASLALIRREGDLRGLREVATASDVTLRRILTVTGGNPLAIKLVVGQLVSLPLGQVLTALKSTQPGSEAFYEYLYRTSWDLLPRRARHLLLQMARLPASRCTWEDLLTATALPIPELAAAIGELTALSLVQAAGLEEKTYTLHPLTHHFVVSQAAIEGNASQTQG